MASTNRRRPRKLKSSPKLTLKRRISSGAVPKTPTESTTGDGDYKWYRDELRSPPHPNRSGSNGVDAKDLSAPPPDLDGRDRCPAACGPLDFPTSNGDDQHGINSLSQPGDYTHVCDPFCLPSQPAGQSESQDLGEDVGEDVESDDDRSPLDDSVEGISRERPPPRRHCGPNQLGSPSPLGQPDSRRAATTETQRIWSFADTLCESPLPLRHCAAIHRCREAR